MIVTIHHDILTTDPRCFRAVGAKTVGEAMRKLYTVEPDLESSFHLVFAVGQPVLRANWDLVHYSEIEVRTVPLGMEAVAVAGLVISIASLAFSAYLIATAPDAAVASTSTLPKAKDVFTFEGQTNKRKINEAVEITYGKNRWYPAYYTLPLIRYAGNQAFIDVWLSLGIGDVEVSDIKIGDSLIADLPGSFAEHKEVGYTPADTDPFDMVFIGDKTNVELKGANEEGFDAVRTIVCPAGAPVSTIQVNLVCPAGRSSSLVNPTFAMYARKVDTNGSPVSQWETPVTFSLPTGVNASSPQRYSYAFDLPGTARWEIRVERTSTSAGGPNENVTCSAIYGMAFSGRASQVGLLRVTIKGTGTVASDSASKINVVTQRKLRTIAAGSWTAPVATRSPIWAIVDFLTADYGGRIPLADLDPAYWADLATKMAETFDTVVSSKTSVWDICQAAASVMKGSMFVVGSDLRIAFDSARAIPVTLFTPDNAKDLTLESTFKRTLEYDCVEAFYVDPVTGLQASVQFTPPGSLATNPKTLTLTGVTDRNLAWRLAAYSYETMYLLRDKVSFTAGMDGLIPMFGDVIAVQWPFPTWASGGVVESFVVQTFNLFLSETVPDDPDLWIVLRRANGEVFGPVPCTKLADKQIVVIPLSTHSDLFDFEGLVAERVQYAIGTGKAIGRNYRVTSVNASGSTVKIEALAYDPEVFVYDSFDAPAEGQDKVPYPTAPGVVRWVRVEQDSSGYLRVWFATPYATQSVRIEYVWNPAGDLRAPATISGPYNDADVVGCTAFLEKEVGTLLLKITTASYIGGVLVNQSMFWRGDIKASGYAYAMASVVLNKVNFNPAQVDSISVGYTLRTVYLLATETSVKLKVDLGVDGPIPVLIRPENKLPIKFVTTDERGFLTFTKEILTESGLLGVAGDNGKWRIASVAGNILLETYPFTATVTIEVATTSKIAEATGLNDYWIMEQGWDYTQPKANILFSMIVESTCAPVAFDWDVQAFNAQHVTGTADFHNRRTTANSSIMVPFFTHQAGRVSSVVMGVDHDHGDEATTRINLVGTDEVLSESEYNYAQQVSGAFDRRDYWWPAIMYDVDGQPIIPDDPAGNECFAVHPAGAFASGDTAVLIWVVNQNYIAHVNNFADFNLNPHRPTSAAEHARIMAATHCVRTDRFVGGELQSNSATISGSARTMLGVVTDSATLQVPII